MAFNNWILIQTPASGGESLYLMKEMLKSAGWTVQGWSDGYGSLSYSNNTGGIDGITTGSSGAGGFNNSGAWIRIQNPDGCEICFQRTATNERNVTITYSASAGFSTGPANAWTLPTATDGQTALSDTQLFNTGGAYYLQGGADDANGYGFWIAGYNAGAGTRFGFIMEPLLQTDVLDTDPGKQNLLISAPWNSLFNNDGPPFNSSNQNAKGWMKDSWVSFAGMSLYSSGNQITFPSTIATNPYSGKDDRAPILWVKPAIALPTVFPYGYKGMGRLMQWEGTSRNTADTKESKTRIVFGQISLPWDGITTPSV